MLELDSSNEKQRAASAVDTALQTLKASNKRKRDSSSQSGLGDGAKRSGIKRSANLNGTILSGEEASNESFTSPGPGEITTSLGTGESSSGSFNALTQHIAQHASRGVHRVPTSQSASSTAAAALAGLMPQLTIPQPTEISFASIASGSDGERPLDSSFELGGHDNDLDPNTQGTLYNLANGPTSAQLHAAREASNCGGTKPPVGSDEWHKVRRDNHKEVERRRRETINEGINELAKIVPGCEKNKGSILQRAVSFITQLRENETRNIEKWTLEKMLTEQAIAEISASVEKLKIECEQAWNEAEVWKKVCQEAGLDPKGEETVELSTSDLGD